MQKEQKRCKKRSKSGAKNGAKAVWKRCGKTVKGRFWPFTQAKHRKTPCTYLYTPPPTPLGTPVHRRT